MSVSSCSSNDFHEHIGVPEAYGTIFYSGNKNMDKALSYLSGCDVSSLKNGTYQIDPGKITITVSDNSLRSESDAKSCNGLNPKHYGAHIGMSGGLHEHRSV